jgi:hypothetical protein
MLSLSLRDDIAEALARGPVSAGAGHGFLHFTITYGHPFLRPAKTAYISSTACVFPLANKLATSK